MSNKIKLIKQFPLTVFVLIFGAFFASVAYLVTPLLAAPFIPGETLDPNCPPGSPTCYIVEPWTSSTSSPDIIFGQLGNVGIGTTSPQSKLDVWGDFSVATGTTKSLYVNSLGKVGIATSTPSQQLTINGNAYLTGALYDSTNNPGALGDLLQSTGTTTRWMATTSLGLGGGGSSQWTSTSSNIYYNLGNVGIGSSSLALQPLTIFASTTVGSTTAPYGMSYFSTGNMSLAQLDGGAYFGRTSIKEKDFEVVNYGQNWNPFGTSSLVWRSLAVSSNGKFMTAGIAGGRLHISSDYGVTWNVVGTTTNKTYLGVAMSMDGKFQSAVASGDKIYVSSDYGITWNTAGPTLNKSWQGIAMSADGRFQSATIANGQIYVSNDYGQTWLPQGPSLNFNEITMSSDGKIQLAPVNGGRIYSSNDYGVNWKIGGPISNYNWEGVAMSSDGKYQSVVVSSGQIYTSSNYGETWTANTSAPTGVAWFSVAMAADGKIQAATIYGGQIYVSTDYGNIWVPKGNSRNWRIVSMSSDGKIIASVVPAGQIYVSHADTYLPGGNLGVGTSTPTAQLTVNGSVRFASLGSAGAGLVTDYLGNVNVSSDERLKNVVSNFDRGLFDIKKINPVNYQWKPETGYDASSTYTGFLAQNIQLAIPEAVATGSTGYLNLADRPIIATLVNAIKEIGSFISKIEKGIAYLKNIVVENLTVGSAEKPTGITFYDKQGRVGCLSVDDVYSGSTRVTPGVCGVTDLSQTQQPELVSTPVTTPIIIPEVSTSTPTTTVPLQSEISTTTAASTLETSTITPTIDPIIPTVSTTTEPTPVATTTEPTPEVSTSTPPESEVVSTSSVASILIPIETVKNFLLNLFGFR